MCLADGLFLILLIPLIHVFALFSEDLTTLNNNYVAEGDTEAIYHAFVQTGSELHYFKDISYQDTLILPLPTEQRSDISLDSRTKSHKNLRFFDEESTDFGKTPLGIPVPRRIYVNNPSSLDVVFSSVICLGANFHCSSLEKQSLASKERTSVGVYFLSRVEEPPVKEETIILHTSIGKFTHKVRGECVGNPYKIRTFSDIRFPLNATFSAPIRLHNPHPIPLRLLEILTSDGNTRIDFQDKKFHNDNNQQMGSEETVLKPFQTRELAIVKILGNIERNTTTFVFIKLLLEEKSHAKNRLLGQEGNKFKSNLITLVIPLEIQVTRRRGIFPTVDLLDFGLIRAGEQPAPLKLSVYSTLERGIEIESINADSSHGVYLQFELRPPISVKSGARGQPGAPVQIASINIDTNLEEKTAMGEEGNIKMEKLVTRRGFIMAESRGGNYNITVPFKAVIYQGSLVHSPEDVSFHQNTKPNTRRDVMLTNTLPFGLAIYSVEVSENAKDSFKASLVCSPVFISAGQSMAVFTLNYIKEKAANFSSHVTLFTNLSAFQVPIFVFDGSLKINLDSPEQHNFHFGVIRSGENRSISFTFFNANPVPLRIKQFHLPFPTIISLKYMGIRDVAKNKSYHSVADHEWRIDDDKNREQNLINFLLPAHSLALFKLSISSARRSSQQFPTPINSTIRIQTQFSSYNLGLQFEMTNSTLLLSIPKKITFTGAFIGTVSTRPLIVLSNFMKKLRILRLSISDGDPRFLFSTANASTIIPTGVPTNIANITFVPAEICPRDCYLGMPLSSSDGQWFAYGMKLPQNLAEIDNYLYSKLRRKWMGMKERLVKTTIKLDTDRIKALEIPVEGHLVWPRLFSHSVVNFPLTAVGNFSIVNLTLTNPSTLPIIVQLLPLVIYPDADELLEFFYDELPAPLIGPVEVNETLMFSLRDTELFTLKPGSPVPKLREEVESIVEGPVPRFTLSMLLRPGMSTRIRIGFLPSDYSLRSSLLIIRNNLTALEPVVLYGRGARMNMEIDNKTARGLPLFFEIEPQHLIDCTNPRRQLHRMPTTLTVRRSFAIRNNGEVGFSVVNISISGLACENRGYKVLNCDKFRLEPNETTFLDIAYTPDFLFSVNEATLQLYMHMNGTPWSFDLSAILPRHLLSVCHAALPRPPFEAVMYQTCVLALIFCLICVLSCAYLEGDRLVMCAYKQQFLQEQEGEVFDLNASELTVDDDSIKIGEHINRKREFLQVSSDAGFLDRWFWQMMNFILWIFSYIWPLIRLANRNDQLTRQPKKKHRQTLQNFAKSSKNTEQTGPTGLKYLGKEPSFDTSVESAIMEFNNASSNKYSDNTDKDSLGSSSKSEENQTNIRSSILNRIILPQNPTSQQNKKVDEPNRKTPKNSGRKKKGEAEKKRAAEEEESYGSLYENGKSAKRFEQKKDQWNGMGMVERNLVDFCLTERTRNRGKLPSFDSSFCSQETNSSSAACISTNSYALDEDLDKTFALDTKITQISNKIPNGNSAQLQPNNDGELFSWNDSDCHSELEANECFDGKGMSEEEESDDIPEWADETVAKGNADVELDTLAAQSAALFNLSDEENGKSTASSNLSRKMDLNIAKEEEEDEEDIETERLIEKLTREYRERLTKILRTGKSLADILTMPPDLSSKFDYSSSSKAERTERRNPSIQTLGGVKNGRKSPGSERTVGTLTNGKQQQQQPIFLFNISDPVWKPIAEYERQSTSPWPDIKKHAGAGVVNNGMN